MTTSEFEDFLDGYLTAAVFSDIPEESRGYADRHDIDEKSLKTARRDCEEFLKDAEALIRSDQHKPGSHDDTPMNHAGRDFWYTRQGHGCGFWDGDWPVNGDELTTLAKKFSERYLRVRKGNGKYTIAIF